MQQLLCVGTLELNVQFQDVGFQEDPKVNTQSGVEGLLAQLQIARYCCTFMCEYNYVNLQRFLMEMKAKMDAL